MLWSVTECRIRIIRARRSSGDISSAMWMASAMPVRSYGLTISASRSSWEAPANRLRMSAPSSSSRTETNSLATRFIPSCSELTTQKPARRGEAQAPRIRLEPLVDIADAFFDLALDLLVAIDGGAAGRSQLHEHQSLAVLRIGLEEVPERGEALRQPLRVVDALDAHTDELGRDPELPQQLGAGLARRIVDELGRDADRERLDVRRVVTARHREALPVDARLDRAIDRLQEVVAVVLRVEPDQVRAEHAE